MNHSGAFTSLDLGPLRFAPGSHVALNLGVGWQDEEPPGPSDVGIRDAIGLGWQPATRIRQVATGLWRGAAGATSAQSFVWSGRQISAHRSIAMPWSISGAVSNQLHLRWHMGMERGGRALSAPWQDQDRRRRQTEFCWRSSSFTGRSWDLGYRTERALADNVRLRWGRPTTESRAGRILWQPPGRFEGKRDLLWGWGKPVPWIVRAPPKPPEPEPEPPRVNGAHVGLNLSCLPLPTRGLAALNLGVAACYVVRPHQRTYVVINSISVVRLPDRLPIEMAGVSINTSCDAWGSTFDFELADTEQLPLLKPSAAGPRQVEVTLNGYVWTALVESYSTRREWNGSGINLAGRSRTALLAAPYAPGRVKVTTEDRSVAQLVNEELADTGFTASYDTVDWVVPAGAWFYDATTALDAISRLAEASGGVVQSDPAAQALQVRARYPDSPWHWKERTPDHVIYEDVVSNESLQMRSAPLYDAVMVTGELAGKGVTCKVRRSGEAGKLFAPQASSPLISTAAAGTERGRNILSDRGEQALVELVIPLFGGPLRPGEVGRVNPLDLVEVVGEEGTWHGLCIAARTEARTNDKAIVIEQTITLERHYTDAD